MELTRFKGEQTHSWTDSPGNSVSLAPKVFRGEGIKEEKGTHSLECTQA